MAGLLTTSLLGGGPVYASAPPEPFENFNGNPLLLATSPPSWLVAPLEPGAFTASLQHARSNSFREHASGQEEAEVDGELGLTTAGVRASLPHGLEASLLLAHASHGSGVMDDLIYQWHDWFGLPQGSRTAATNDRFAYSYTDSGKPPVRLTAPTSALASLRLGLNGPLQWLDRQWLLQGEIRLPTGASKDKADAVEDFVEEFFDAGAWAASFGAGTHGEATFLGWPLVWFGASGLTLQDGGDSALADRRKALMLSWRLGARWRLAEGWWLQTQLDGNTPAYASDLHELGGVPAQLTSGLTIKLSPRWTTDLTFSEDLNPGVSADFTAALRVKYLWSPN